MKVERVKFDHDHGLVRLTVVWGPRERRDDVLAALTDAFGDQRHVTHRSPSHVDVEAHFGGPENVTVHDIVAGLKAAGFVPGPSVHVVDPASGEVLWSGREPS